MSEKNEPLTITGESSIAICTCMCSNHWPYCDASHHTMGGDGPKIVELDPNKTYQLCQCHKTKTQPFCDGSHKGKE